MWVISVGCGRHPVVFHCCSSSKMATMVAILNFQVTSAFWLRQPEGSGAYPIPIRPSTIPVKSPFLKNHLITFLLTPVEKLISLNRSKDPKRTPLWLFLLIFTLKCRFLKIHLITFFLFINIASTG